MVNFNINKLKISIIKAVKKVVDEKMKKLGYCKTVYGIVRQCNVDSSYDVEIHGLDQRLYAMNNGIYNIGDVVVCLVLDNRNYSNKMILCKKPTVI